MKAGMVRWLVLAMGLLALAGCGHNQSAPLKITPVPPAQPFVFYDETGDPSERIAALSGAELREVIDWVATQTSDRVWLIRVRPSMGKTRNDMVAYLVPDEATPRIRVGRAYDIRASKGQTGVRSPWKYAQVSAPDHSFGEQFTKPSAREMPFYFPEVVDPDSGKTSPVSKEEIVAVLDFVRLRSSDMPVMGRPIDHTTARESSNLPVLEISEAGKEIEVMFGFQHGPLWGHGVIARIEHTTTGYKIVGWSHWIS